MVNAETVAKAIHEFEIAAAEAAAGAQEGSTEAECLREAYVARRREQAEAWIRQVGPQDLEPTEYPDLRVFVVAGHGKFVARDEDDEFVILADI